ncbi:hypothetical protein COV06_04270 [Candidatus Uhrbacteria bacterium CG10_big_fil_rev_8_21_14_0_10_50_16]|uniref:Uncharacterized protein n=1 Tax=Candidatus Uhrbacteria bacterium CG10_big_fil_rev_8_21_14_0_10_50_16 TaxID=1975039 RepID=A0A2H0RLC8_9BACT|nr:MAG: hypothetical protein COV06_04270 [Candidatus Uhrbacteria bacterium CG10_big_fil_rev_8_21_14_0_10_50_16]
MDSQYAFETVQSQAGYPRLYTGPQPIRVQITLLSERLGISPEPAMSNVERTCRAPLPEGAEGWFAVPSLAGLTGGPRGNAPERYLRGMRRVVGALCAFGYKRTNRVLLDVAISYRTAECLAHIAEQQAGGIWVIPAQFGKRFAGASAQRAKMVCAPDEFPLDIICVGAMLLAHPTQLPRLGDLGMICGGNDNSLLKSQPATLMILGRNQAPEIQVMHGSVHHAYLGVPTGFVPQLS